MVMIIVRFCPYIHRLSPAKEQLFIEVGPDLSVFFLFESFFFFYDILTNAPSTY